MGATGLAKTGGRQKGTPNRSTPGKKSKIESFFHDLLDDETEAKFWRYFMSGYVVDTQADGTQRIIPIPVDPVCWSSFKRAVEYKRGMPVQPIAAKFEGALQVIVEHIGRSESSPST